MSDNTNFEELINKTFDNNDTHNRSWDMTHDVFTLARTQTVHKITRCTEGFNCIRRSKEKMEV